MSKEKNKVEIRFPYGPRKRHPAKTGNADTNKTEASHARGLETESLIKRYVANPLAQQQAINAPYLDVPALEFTAAMQMVRNAENAFMELPPQIRQKYHNNPANLLRALETGEDTEALTQLGLINAQETMEKPTEKTEEKKEEKEEKA